MSFYEQYVDLNYCIQFSASSSAAVEVNACVGAGRGCAWLEA
jgi:hypothetical protein